MIHFGLLGRHVLVGTSLHTKIWMGRSIVKYVPAPVEDRKKKLAWKGREVHRQT